MHALLLSIDSDHSSVEVASTRPCARSLTPQPAKWLELTACLSLPPSCSSPASPPPRLRRREGKSRSRCGWPTRRRRGGWTAPSRLGRRCNCGREGPPRSRCGGPPRRRRGGWTASPGSRREENPTVRTATTTSMLNTMMMSMSPLTYIYTHMHERAAAAASLVLLSFDRFLIASGQQFWSSRGNLVLSLIQAG